MARAGCGRRCAKAIGTLAASLVATLGGLTVSATLAPSAGATGTTLYASVGGSGTTCSSSSECSLTTALSESQDTGTVRLATGTYLGTFTVRASLTGLTLRPSSLSSKPALTILEGNVATTTPTLTLDTAAHVTVERLEITHSTSDNGAGVKVTDATLTLTRVLVKANSDTAGGGGVVTTATSTVTVTDSTITGNTAVVGGGGGIAAITTVLLVKTSTISGNVSTSDGGGIFVQGAKTYVVETSTISGNKVTSTGSQMYATTSAKIYVAASVVIAQGQGHEKCNYASGGSFADAGYNLSDTGTGGGGCNYATSTVHSKSTATFGTTPTTAHVGALGTHGGTVTTVPLLETPPLLIPKATTLTVISKAFAPCTGKAQNGVTRTAGTRTSCDPGAFQYKPSSTTATSSSSSSSSTTTSSSSSSPRPVSKPAPIPPPSRVAAAPTPSPSAAGTPTPSSTAVAAFETAFPVSEGRCAGTAGTRTVILATDVSYYDALSAEYLASSLHTGVLLSTPEHLGATVAAAIAVEGITHVVVVGGPLAISQGIVGTIAATRTHACGGGSTPGGGDVTVTRISGATMVATAAEVASVPVPSSVSVLDLLRAYGTYEPTGTTVAPLTRGPQRSALLVSTDDPLDAEAVSAASYAAQIPLLLTTAGELSPAAAGALHALSITQVIVAGGPLAITPLVVSQLVAAHVSVLRIAGATAQATASKFSDFELAASSSSLGLGWRPTGGVVVAGVSWQDAIPCADLAAYAGEGVYPEPVLETETSSTVGSPLTAYLGAAHAGGIGADGNAIATFTALGGPSTLSAGVFASVASLVGG